MEPTIREQPDLRSLLATLWRRKWTFLGIFVSIPVLVFIASSLLAKTYEATALMRIKTPTLEITSIAPDSLSAVETEALLAKTEQVGKEAARQLDLPTDAADSLLGAVRVEPVESTSGTVTELVRLTASDEQAGRAAEIANAYARAIDVVRSRTSIRQLDNAIVAVQSQLDDTTDPTAKAQLATQLQELRGARATANENTETIQEALPPATPVSPHPRRNTALAAVISLLLALGAVAIIERLDRRLRDSSELEPLLGAPLLSVIPRAAFPGARPSPGPVREAFRTLTASLVYFNIERPLQTVVIASPTQGDGKTTVAVHLAAALAKDGQNVVLVDCDLRHPQVALRLGIEPVGGLVEVVVGRASVRDVLVDVPVGDRGGGRLRVLASGTRPPNPARLLGSKRMRPILAELAAMADIVLLDTPPILNVSDAVPLLERVSGVVLAAKVGGTSTDALLRVRQVLETLHADLLGTVATGAAGAGLYGYGGGYYAAEGSEEAAQPEGQPDAAVAAIRLESDAEAKQRRDRADEAARGA
jgi:polysaccharide biosynthesis transport protein